MGWRCGHSLTPHICLIQHSPLPPLDAKDPKIKIRGPMSKASWCRSNITQGKEEPKTKTVSRQVRVVLREANPGRLSQCLLMTPVIPTHGAEAGGHNRGQPGQPPLHTTMLPQASKHSRLVVLNLGVMPLLRVKRPFHRSHLKPL